MNEQTVNVMDVQHGDRIIGFDDSIVRTVHLRQPTYNGKRHALVQFTDKRKWRTSTLTKVRVFRP